MADALHDVIDRFTQAMREAGIETEATIQADGQRHRFRVTGDKAGSDNGWYVLHLDGVPAGAFGCWKRGISETWCAKSTTSMTHAERQALHERMEAARRAQEIEQARAHAECKAKAERLWNEAAETISADHQYLVAKGVKSYGLRQLRDALLVPVRADAGGLVGLQFIQPDGTKRFLTATPKAGSYHRITGDLSRVLICEGYATGASLHEATGCAVAIAFDAGNLLAVSQAIRDKLPDAVLVLCAEDDRHNPANPGMTKARAAAQAVGGLVAVPSFGVGSTGTDFNDMRQAQGIEAVRAAIEAAVTPGLLRNFESQPVENLTKPHIENLTKPDIGDVTISMYDPEGRKKSQPTVLVEIAAPLELFHDADGTGYAIVPKDSARQVMAVRQSAFREYLSHQYFTLTGKGAGGQAIQDAIDTIEARAKFACGERLVYLRIAEVGQRIYLDLCDEQWRVVEVDGNGWRVLPESPVMFVRRKDMRPLPEPVAGGSIDQLRQFVNVSNQDWPLVYGWALSALRGTPPFPVLILQGEQGSGKSTSARAIKELIDPAGAPLLSPPRDPADLSTIAASTYVIALDNLSGLTGDMSDALCRISTGAGTAKRKLYTDNELESVSYSRPVLVNGIDEIANRSDLMSRSVQPELPILPDHAKTGERTLWADYEKARPLILGAMLDMTAKGLAGFDGEEQPKTGGRLRDWARWVSAAERGAGMPLLFAGAYQRNVDDGVAHAIEASPFAVAIIKIAQRGGGWSGTSTDLLTEVRGLVDEFEQKAKGFPQTNRAIGDALRRAGPNLRNAGVAVTAARGERRIINLDWVGKTSSLSSASSGTQQRRGFQADQHRQAIVIPPDDNVRQGAGHDDADDVPDDVQPAESQQWRGFRR